MNGLEARPEWFVIGPLMALVVVGLFLAIDQRIGVLGGFSGIVERVTGRSSELSWRTWFLFGVIGGAVVFTIALGRNPAGDGYGWLTREFSSDALVVAILAGAGVLIGYGTKLAGGCTSGNGIGGCSTGSPASLSATAAFMGTAIGVSLLIEALI